jgi:hypothetical protein
MNGCRPILTLRKRALAPAVPAAESAPLPAAAPVEDVPHERFAFVWAVGGPCPRKRHPDVESAKKEAARLRRVAPERADSFAVYEAVLVKEEHA